MKNGPIEMQVTRASASIEAAVRTGEAHAVPVPDRFMKETYDTLVWSAAEDGVGSAFYKIYRRRRPASWCKERLTRMRAEREYDRLRVLDEAGVPCCPPLYCGWGRHSGHGRYELLATRAIPFPRKLADCLSGDGYCPLENLFATIRAMHRAGVYHGTLTPNNIVVSEPPNATGSFHVVDLPRAIDFPYDVADCRMGWYDLLHFVHRTSAFIDRARCLDVLDCYEFPAAKRERFIEASQCYAPSKWLRYRLKNEFGFTAWMDKRTGRRTGRPFPRSM